MRILHTSDWHLGKTLEQASRLDEQKAFIEELKTIADEENIDLILIAGDIYDTQNPPAAAEKLFYSSIMELSNKGKRPIIIIPGNHDSQDRLTAPTPLFAETGIILSGFNTEVPVGKREYYSIINSGKNFFEIEINGERAVIAALPYPSEKRLNEILFHETEEKEIQKTYSAKIGDILNRLSENFRKDTVNIILSHFFITGGQESSSERNIQLGGSMAVHSSDLPGNAHYIAMGHLHRPQKVPGIENAYYSGSPIQYSKSEVNYAKCVMIADITASGKTVIEKRYLRNYKPIEVWKAASIENALELCEKHKDDSSWVFIEINTDRVLTPSEIKQMKTLKKDILEISPVFAAIDADTEELEYKEKTIYEDFLDFYRHIRGTDPDEKTKELFLQLTENEMIE